MRGLGVGGRGGESGLDEIDGGLTAERSKLGDLDGESNGVQLGEGFESRVRGGGDDSVLLVADDVSQNLGGLGLQLLLKKRGRSGDAEEREKSENEKRVGRALLGESINEVDDS